MDPASNTRPQGERPTIGNGRIGVLIVNLGTPEATGYWPMRRYLKEFLSDRRVIETPRILWWPILNGIVLTTRPRRSGQAYDKIWNRELDESPLKTITRAQCHALAARLAERDGRIVVDWAMRYGLPPINAGLRRLREQGCNRILVFPLYPQYSAATTATVNDVAFAELMRMRAQPAIRTVPPYYDDPSYISALAGSLRSHLEGLATQPDVVVASFHGLPQEYVDKGDPYYDQCHETARLLRRAMGWDEQRLLVTFQSRFGRAEWLKPYTDDTVAALARDGTRRLAIITPGFAADCVETLEEIALGTAEVFRQNGGESFSVVPCLNDSPRSIAMLYEIAARELSGWIAHA